MRIRLCYEQKMELDIFTGTHLSIVIIDATWNVNACYYEVSYASARSLRMRRSTSLFLDGKYNMFCSRENKQSRVYKIGVHYDLQNSSIFPLYLRHLCFSANGLTCRYKDATETHYILKVLLFFFVLVVNLEVYNTVL